jgi:flagellar P-ring protein precursor FlgI
MAVPAATTLSDLAQALNTLGVTASDVIAIFQALKEAGAMDAELVVI